MQDRSLDVAVADFHLVSLLVVRARILVSGDADPSQDIGSPTILKPDFDGTGVNSPDDAPEHGEGDTTDLVGSASKRGP